MQVTYWLEHAWLDEHVEPDVALVTTDGRITQMRTGVEAPPPGATVLRGLTLPGLANAHSHAFHRALRGTVQVGTGTFWTWRDIMYSVAFHLTPDSYFDLARAVYAEMALAGITCVGEFHYLHHQHGGAPYDNPNAMGEALIAAAQEAGIRITLLDTAYLHGGLVRGGYRPLEGVQSRFGDGTADRWYQRWLRLKGGDQVRIGAALHSVRAFSDRDGYAVFAERMRLVPVHIHLSEQPAENDACVAVHGRTPPGCSPTPASGAATPPRCTPPTSPVRTSACSAVRTPPCACAPPPSGTSPTASDRRPNCGAPAAC